MSRPGVARRALFAASAVLAATASAWVVGEGVVTLANGAQAEVSLAYTLYTRWRGAAAPAGEDPLDASTHMVTSVAEIRRLLPLMREAGMGLGNSPFSRLRTKEASINADDGPCRVQKPNLSKTVGFLRTNLFNPFDPMTFFYDSSRALPPELEAFLQRYAFRRVRLTTNAHGERRTLPGVDADRLVLVAGDSVANGAMLDDRETLASRLQRRDASRRYVNLGIAGAKAADVVCALERAAARYRGRIDQVVYVLCENDWSTDAPYGNPGAIVRWLDEFRRRESVGRVTVLYMPYIYNTSPELTRLRGHEHYAFPTFAREKHELLRLAGEAGFGVIDYLGVTAREQARRGSQFAALALYVDHSHPSPLGIRRVLPLVHRAVSADRAAAATSRAFARAGSEAVASGP